MRKTTLLSFLLFTWSFSVFTNTTYGEIYYDIDFSSPVHVVGQSPTIDGSPETPSSILYGNPTVVASYGQFTDQPLLFNTEGNKLSPFYETINLSMNKGKGFYYTSFDLLTHNLIGSRNSFTIFFDNPYAGGLTFANFGRMNTGVFDFFEDDVPMHIEVMTDFINNNYKVLINRQIICDKQYFTPGHNPEVSDLVMIRFHLGLDIWTNEPDVSSYVAVDNIIVADYVVPEPATLLLLGLGSLLIKKRCHNISFKY